MTTPDDAPLGSLGERGRALWLALGGDARSAPRKVLLLEAARCVDRLERLDAALKGDLDPRLLGEARQQQQTLTKLLTVLGAAADGPAVDGSGSLDQLAARRRVRDAGA